MFPAQVSRINPDEFSRCEELKPKTDQGKSISPDQKTDAILKESINHALWKDDVLRAIEQYEIEIHVRNAVVYLNGHIVSTTSLKRVETAIRTVPGVRGLQNNLVLDDKLTNDIATSLAELEHTYDCKFFTGASHGVISLNGIVRDENVKLLAGRYAVSNPNVRGVINHVRVSGDEAGLRDLPFLQPTLGATIYFQDGVSGVIRQVIVDPGNRRVVAMTVWVRFADQRQQLKPLNHGEAQSPERLVVIPMEAIRYLTGASGFLHIKSTEQERYMDFDPASFVMPRADWTPPFPYCPADVLFPCEDQMADIETAQPHEGLFEAVAEGAHIPEQLLVNDSLGG